MRYVRTVFGESFEFEKDEKEILFNETFVKAFSQ